MSSTSLLNLSILWYLVGAILVFVLGKFRQYAGTIALIFVILAASGLLTVGGNVLLSGKPMLADVSYFTVNGLQAHLSFQVDLLSALFLLLIALISLLTTLYSIKFMQSGYFQRFNLGAYYLLLLTFFAALTCVVTLTDMFFFFIAWEMMTLTSYILVIYEKEDRARLRAGFKYFFMTHVATALMFIGGIIIFLQAQELGLESPFSFEAFRQTMTKLSAVKPGLLHLILTFFFIGFSTKAGLLPFGDWLPDAYPSAPSSAGAAFGGIMSKIGVYGLIRIFLDFLPATDVAATWGMVLGIAGTISIFVASMTALNQDEAKKLLGFSVIGQVGYIVLALGFGIYLLQANQPQIALVAFVAALFHLLNNVFFKSTLFMNAGSIFYKTGVDHLNQVGGLAKVMQITAATCLIAGLSMAGVPLLSGFASKWLIFQATVAGGSHYPIFFVMGIIALFTSTITLAYVLKFYNVFLGTPFVKAPSADRITHLSIPFSMNLAQLLGAFFSILLGLLPMLVVKYLFQISASLASQSLAFESVFANSLTQVSLTLPRPDGSLNQIASWNPIAIFMAGIVGLGIAFFFYRAGGAPIRENAVWYCGEPHGTEETRYAAANLFLTFKQLFYIRIGKYQQAGVYPHITYPAITPSENWWFKKIIDLDHWFYEPLVNYFMKALRNFSYIHSGIPHVYLLWLVLGAILAVFTLFIL
ncbi:hypothetical protein L0128_01150 [candidate division KSB1 bacterium]|nr:hypothetical protein [candidate division KSB1 bacterium]